MSTSAVIFNSIVGQHTYLTKSVPALEALVQRTVEAVNEVPPDARPCADKALSSVEAALNALEDMYDRCGFEPPL